MMVSGIYFGSQDCFLVANRVLLRLEKGKKFGSWLQHGLLERIQKAHGAEYTYLSGMDF